MSGSPRSANPRSNESGAAIRRALRVLQSR
jgi:hypothetical protein